MAVLGAVRDAGIDIEVNSGGELFKALRAGFRPDQIIFNGTSKTDEELDEAVRARHLRDQRRFDLRNRVGRRSRAPRALGIELRLAAGAQSRCVWFRKSARARISVCRRRC